MPPGSALLSNVHLERVTPEGTNVCVVSASGVPGRDVCVEGEEGSIQGGQRILPMGLVYSLVRWGDVACREPKGQGIMVTMLLSLFWLSLGLFHFCSHVPWGDHS